VSARTAASTANASNTVGVASAVSAMSAAEHVVTAAGSGPGRGHDENDVNA
jgi:hypothetical protein